MNHFGLHAVSLCVCECVPVCLYMSRWPEYSFMFWGGGLKSTGSFIVWPYFAVTESWMNLQCCVRKAEQMLTVNIADRPHILRYFLMHWLSHLHSFCMFVISYIWGIGALLWFTLIKWQNFLTFFFNPLQSVEFTKKMLNTSFSWVCN